MKKYQVWHEESRTKDSLVTVEVDSIEEAEIALKALATYSFQLNHHLVEEFPNQDPFEFTKEHCLGGIMVLKNGDYVDLVEENKTTPKGARFFREKNGEILYYKTDMIGSRQILYRFKNDRWEETTLNDWSVLVHLK